MVTIETSINSYAKQYNEFLTYITCAKVMCLGDQTDATLREMHKNWDAALSAAIRCNVIADKIGFKSLTADFDPMMTPEDAVRIFLHGEEKAVA